jgi:DNA-binding transcriptional regulator LsrR (DeoR family)
MATVTSEELEELKNGQVIGDIGSSFFDQDGNEVATSLSKRMIGLSLADLTKIPDTVILASGEEKILAIKALLKNRIIDHLIIDASIAEAL